VCGPPSVGTRFFRLPDEVLDVSGTSNGQAQVPGELHRRGRLTAEGLAPLRRALADWAGQIGLGASTVEAIVLSGYEALANSVEHAYRDHDGPVELDASVNDLLVTVTVTDHGCWRPPPADPGSRGHGISLIHKLGAVANVAGTPQGTTVTMTWHLDST